MSRSPRATALRTARTSTHHAPRREGTPPDERGAVLILALLFLVIGVVAVGALAFQVTNDVTNSSHFRTVRSLQYAAKSSTNLAIQNIRYTPLLSGSQTTLNASPPAPCWLNSHTAIATNGTTTLTFTGNEITSITVGMTATGAGITGLATVTAVNTGTNVVTISGTISTLTTSSYVFTGINPESELASIDGEPAMASWCSTSWTPISANTRTVTISTCPASTAAQQCAAAPLLQAVVSYDDYPPQEATPPSTAPCSLYCGTSMITNSWVWSPIVPTVTGISPGSGPITGGTPVTITGTGFTPSSTVSFVEESGGTPASDNTVLPAANVVYTSPTSITATTPSVMEGTTYYVTVTTLKGTSAQGPLFTYTPVAPLVSSISPSGGSIAGGNSVTITGSGFVNNALVKFVQESNGTPVTGGVTVSCHVGLLPCQVNVLSSTSLTVVSPGVVTGTTYFITVTTPGEPTSPTSANDVFTFSPLVPTVSIVSPNAGPDAGGTSIVITGTGFVNGDTVSFVKESAGCGGGISASNVTVVGSRTITANSPAVFAAAPYYVYVTTPGLGSSSCYPVFNYTG